MIMHSCPSTPEAERQPCVEEVRATGVAGATRDVVSALAYPTRLLFVCVCCAPLPPFHVFPFMISPRHGIGANRVLAAMFVSCRWASHQPDGTGQIFASWSRGSISALLVLWWVLVRVLHMLDVCDSCALFVRLVLFALSWPTFPLFLLLLLLSHSATTTSSPTVLPSVRLFLRTGCVSRTNARCQQLN
jgi:hypothetical protein